MGIKFDVNKLLKPYIDGGSKENPSERTLETITSTLIVKNQINPKIVGGIVTDTLWQMANSGLSFDGDGSYGSKGKELFKHIRRKCIEATERQSVDVVVKSMMNRLSCANLGCQKRTKKIIRLSRWDRVKLFLLKPRGWWKV